MDRKTLDMNHGILGATQRGAVLMISLIFLVVLTLIGISSVNMSVVEENMAGNLRDSNLAFQAAETALRGGEAWLAAQATAPTTICSSTPCELWNLDGLNNGVFTDQTHSWWQGNARPFTTALTGVTTAPRFIVEYHSFRADSLKVGSGSVSGAYFYRVSARGTGGSDVAQAVVQSTYSRRY